MLSISITLYIALKLNIKLTRIDKSTGKQTIYYFLPGWFSGWRSGEVQGGPHVPSVGHEVPLKPQLIGVPRLIVDSIEQLRGLEVALQIAQSFDKAQKVRDEEGASIAVDHYVSTFRTVVKKAQHVALTNGNEHLTEEILSVISELESNANISGDKENNQQIESVIKELNRYLQRIAYQ